MMVFIFFPLLMILSSSYTLPQTSHNQPLQVRCPGDFNATVGDVTGIGLGRFPVESIAECGQKCRQDQGCNSFNYSPTQLHCVMYEETQPTAPKYEDFHFCMKKCSGNHFSCLSGQCIEQDWRCDGEEDCNDGSDEKTCQDYVCPTNQFSCSSGECIHGLFRCDGDEDCKDGSDEDYCEDHDVKPALRDIVNLRSAPIPAVATHGGQGHQFESIGTIDPARLTIFAVDTTIQFRYARTSVHLEAVNPSEVPQQFPFIVTIPETAFVMNMSLTYDGVEHVAWVEEKELSERQYQKAVNKGQTAAQVKKTERDSNRVSVDVNIEPGETISMVVTYEELLERKLGRYEYSANINPGSVVDNYTVNIHINESLPIKDVQSFKISDNALNEDELVGDVEFVGENTATITYNPSRQDQEQERVGTDGITGQIKVEYDVDRNNEDNIVQVMDGYFVHFFAPENENPLPKHSIFVLDTSGSMEGVKMEQLKNAMEAILKESTVRDYISIVSFSDAISVWDSSSYQVSEVRNEAIRFILELDAHGWTDINQALLTAINAADTLKQREENVYPIVIFLTDGEATAGETNSEIILENLQNRNARREVYVPIISLAFGADADFVLLKDISLNNFGFAKKIYEGTDAEIQLEGFYQTISKPVLKNVKFEYVGDIWEKNTLSESGNIPTTFKGGENIAVGKLSPGYERSASENQIIINGKTANGGNKYNHSIGFSDITNIPSSSNINFIERLWAFKTIKLLLTTDPEDSTKEATNLSLKYNFVTELTSLIVTKPGEGQAEDSTGGASHQSLKVPGIAVISILYVIEEPGEEQEEVKPDLRRIIPDLDDLFGYAIEEPGEEQAEVKPEPRRIIPDLDDLYEYEIEIDPDYPPSLPPLGLCSIKFVEECRNLDIFPTLPMPGPASQKYGVHPVVCCPKISNDLFVKSRTPAPVDVPKVSDDDCSAYAFWGNGTRCVNLKDCPALFGPPPNPNSTSPGFCGWDDEDKVYKVCCPGASIQNANLRVDVEPRYPGYKCHDKVDKCQQWKDNQGCRTDMDFVIDPEDPDSSKVKSRVMFNFMAGSCMETCELCGDKGCRDEHPDCPDWSRQGYCIDKADFMVHTCRESCGVCGFLSTDDTKVQVIGENTYSDFRDPKFDCGRFKLLSEFKTEKKRNAVEEDYDYDAPGTVRKQPQDTVEQEVDVFFSNDESGLKYCGATVLSDKWMVTASHCYDDFPLDNTDASGARKVPIHTIRDNTPFKEIIEIKRIYRHPKYVHPNTYNDIALIELGRRLDYNWTKYGDSPQCIDRVGLNEGKTATIQGHGTTENGTLGDPLETNVTIIGNDQCKTTLVHNTTDKPCLKEKINHGLPNGLGDQMFCAQATENEPGIIQGACKGDSGGPLFVSRDDGRQMLVGFVSGGIGCGQGYPSWHTKVSYFVPWIECIIDNSIKNKNNKEKIEEECGKVADQSEEEYNDEYIFI